ncbi:MAG: hypothetical protein HY816_06025 [Candidatus Wallbacteria bacterium]|nr:hypothetical protein [Candidatus Wallbacteria bacterium]
MAARRRATLTLLLAALVIPGIAAACDPDHSWKLVSQDVRRRLSPRALTALAVELSARLGAEEPGGSGARAGKTGASTMAVLEAIDQSPASTGPSAATICDLWADALKRANGARVVDVSAVSRRLALEKRGASGIFDTAFLESLSKHEGAQLFVKVRIVAYESELRQLEDLAPANRGLRATQLFERVRARVSVQDASGAYRLLEELEGFSSESFLYFAEGDSPVRLVEVHMDRPGEEPLVWRAVSGRAHFELGRP